MSSEFLQELVKKLHHKNPKFNISVLRLKFSNLENLRGTRWPLAFLIALSIYFQPVMQDTILNDCAQGIIIFEIIRCYVRTRMHHLFIKTLILWPKK